MIESRKRLATWVLAGIVVCLAGASTAKAQSIEELRREFATTMEALNKRITALEEQNRQLLEILEGGSAEVETSPKLEQRVQTLEEKTARPPGALDVYWKEGLRLDSAELSARGNKAFQLKIGGKVHLDFGAFDTGGGVAGVMGDAVNGVEFRRARISIGGKIYEDFEFKTEYDFAGGDVDFKDVWMAANGIPVLGTIKIGHFKEPASFDEMTSDNNITLIERALPNVFVPSRNTGIGFTNNVLNGRMTYAAGAFKDSDSFGTGLGNDNYAFTGRVTGLPVYREDGRRLVHLGAWATIRNMYDNNFRYRQRPEAHLAPNFVDTAQFAADDVFIFGGEVAAVFGPGSIQAEYIHSTVDVPGMRDLDFGGFYVQGSYFLTGEHRPYKTSSGTFGTIRPKKNFDFGPDGGPGAWELALRYSHLDLDDGTVRGGEMQNITLGVNWYLNPNMRIMLNYVHAEMERDAVATDDGHIIALSDFDAANMDHAFFAAYDDDFDALIARFQVTW